MKLRCENLVKKYGIRTVVKGVSMEVNQGEIVGFLGPNGAGKTTSFYMITGQIVPNEGHVYLDDKEITKLPMYKRAQMGVGYLPQDASVFRKMSVEDNILSVMEMKGIPKKQRMERLAELISEFNLSKVRKSLGIQLSGGERRRCEIARALSIDPKFILLDEPFAGVDPIAVEDIQYIIAKLKYKNIGVIITDHNVGETLAITDRAYLLYEGTILQEGTPAALAADEDVRTKYLGAGFVLKRSVSVQKAQDEHEAKLALNKEQKMKILIIDDERSIRNSLREILTEEGYVVDVAEDGVSGVKAALGGHYDVIFSDIKMPQMDGVEVLGKLVAEGVDSPVVMISGHADINTAVDCIKKGAFDFIEKPLDLNRVLITIKNATDKVALTSQNKILKKKVFGGGKMIGESEPMMHIREMISKVAPTPARVLIIGPNGSGKELVARSLHAESDRSAAPYIEVNCAAIPSELIESELFGHEKGSFTSAIKQHKGKFEQADGGTLFLDEIGDMSLAAQAKVLRVLQENKLSRVGSDVDIKVDVRVIAATNKDLRKEIEAGNFREDLYHRLSVIVIKVPSLDERKSDIPLLIDYFVEQVCNETALPRKTFSQEAVQYLTERSWKGNIRELRNVVERLLILGDEVITIKNIEDYV